MQRKKNLPLKTLLQVSTTIPFSLTTNESLPRTRIQTPPNGPSHYSLAKDGLWEPFLKLEIVLRKIDFEFCKILGEFNLRKREFLKGKKIKNKK